MVYLHKILVAACVSLALALTFSCSLDDIVDDKSSSSLGGDSSSSLSSGGTGGVSSSSSSEVTVSSSSSSEGTVSSSSSYEESGDGSVSCLFRNYANNYWYCYATSPEYGEAECAAAFATAAAEAEENGYYFDADYIPVSSCDGYPTEPEIMPFGSAGAGCLVKDYEDGDYLCRVVSTKDKCSDEYSRFVYEPVDSCEGYSAEWELLHGCLILGTNGEERTCVEVPNETHCNKIFTNYGGSSSEFIDSCAGHGVG